MTSVGDMPARHDRFVLAWLIGWSLPLLAFHAWIGPAMLHMSHIELGRHLLFGEPVVNPAHPMFGYAILIAALGPWTLLLNTVVGWAGFLLTYRACGLGRASPSLLFLAAIAVYAAMITSWNDHALWLGLILLGLGVSTQYGERGVRCGVVVGLLWGGAYNIRPETLPLFAFYLLVQVGLETLGFSKRRLKVHLVSAAVFVLCMVPWAIYTTAVLGKYTPTTTHGWSVAYYSLGLVPGNEYKIIPDDQWLAARAQEIGEPSPWSERANEHFREEFMGIVSSDPGFFVEKMFWGLYTFVRSGPYFPDIRLLAGATPEDSMRLNYATRDLLASIGWPRSLWAAPIRDLTEPPPSPPTVLDMLLAGLFFIVGKLLMLTFLLAFALIPVMMLTRPLALLRQGPLLALAAAVLALSLAVAAILLPTTRASTAPMVLAALLAQAARGERRTAPAPLRQVTG